MPGQLIESPTKTSTFSASDDSLNRDREDDCSDDTYNYEIYDTESVGEYSGQQKQIGGGAHHF